MLYCTLIVELNIAFSFFVGIELFRFIKVQTFFCSTEDYHAITNDIY
jgi:hypothetical protein